METNSNLVSAVEGLLKARTDGVTFVELVRELWERKFDPSREQVQQALTQLRDSGCPITVRDGVLVWTINDLAGDEVYHVVELGEHTVEDIGAVTDALVIEGDWAGLTVAVCSTPDAAYHDCITDWFGNGGARAVYRVDRLEDSAELLWVQLGAATLRQPAMPVREPVQVEPSEDMCVQAETDAVRKAVCRALNDNDYRRLRRDAVQGVVKLSFSVKVDLDKHLCDAVMSGNIKLTNDASVLIENPAQLKLDL